MWWNNTQKEKGVALYLAIIVMALLLGIALGVGSILFGGVRLLRGVGHSVAALYAAEAGLETVLYEDSQGSDITGCDGTAGAPSFCKRSLSNGAAYEVVVQSPDGVVCSAVLYCAGSAGTFQNSVRKIFIER